MNWIYAAITVLVVGAMAVLAVRAERRPDPAPERDIGAVDLPAVRGELVLRDVQLDRHQRRARVSRYRNDRGDDPR